MAIKRPKPEEIAVMLRQVEVLMRQGMSRIDATARSCDRTNLFPLEEEVNYTPFIGQELA